MHTPHGNSGVLAVLGCFTGLGLVGLSSCSVLAAGFLDILLVVGPGFSSMSPLRVRSLLIQLGVLITGMVSGL